MAVDLATKSLLHDKLRFFITVSGVAFAVTLVFVQVGLFLGLMDNASLTIDQIDLYEINEAFASQAIRSTPISGSPRTTRRTSTSRIRSPSRT